jgi:hypothetical protein
LFSLYTSVNLTRADIAYRENTSESLRSAARLDPRAAAIRLALGVQLDLAGGDPEPEFRAAAALSPFLAEPWLRLGVLAEGRGDPQSAERHFLHAADLERQLRPRAALMSFYARQGDSAAFWRWARLAFERGHGDLTPLFNLCWQMAGDPAEVYEKAIPRNRFMLRSYVAYLLSRGTAAALPGPARDLVAVASPVDADLILAACDRLQSLDLWNAACLRGVIPYDPLDPDRSPSLVNPGFRNKPLQQGFDWKVLQHNEIATSLLPDGGIEFSFSGRQPESVLLLSQVAPIPAGKRWRLSIEYRTERVSNPSGLYFEEVMLPASETIRTETVEFVGPTVRLRYQRPSGSVRTEGTVVIRFVRLESLP